MVDRPGLLISFCLLAHPRHHALDEGTHLQLMFLDTAIELVLGACTYKVVLRIIDFIISIAVDIVRQNIYIKGQLVQIPVKLGEFPVGWTYILYDKQKYGLEEGRGMAKMYYCGEEMGTVMLDNCYDGKEDESTVYSISTSESDR